MFQIDLIPIFKRHLNEGAPQVQIIKHPLKVQTIVLKIHLHKNNFKKRKRDVKLFNLQYYSGITNKISH